MAKAQKQELAVIDFTQFSVAQLPELKGKKEEIKSVIEANPIVEIVDNATYESAKKSRTAVKTLRTGLEKEQKDVKKKIKECVLDVVDKEYDTLVLGVKSAEQSRQEPIDVWEEKKEQEKREKAIAEQQRIDGIKTKISDYVASWKEAFSFMVFGSIKEVSDNFHESNNTFNKTALQEFDVLFDREISTLTELLENKISTLEEQEKIRVDNLLIQEKNAEQSLIQEWQRTWNANIDTLSVSDIVDVKSVLVKSKLANLKHYVSGYEEIFASTEKRLNSQIEFVSKAEEQRIAQEKLEQEKKEFEEKQAEAKFKERIAIFKDLGLEFGNFNGANACYGNQDLNLFYTALYITDAPDDRFEEIVLEIKQKIKESKSPVEEIEVVAEEVEPKIEYVVPRNVLPSNTTDNIDEIANNDAFIQEVEFEETWDSIKNDLSLKFDLKNEFVSISVVFEYLKENYNVPAKKQ